MLDIQQIVLNKVKQMEAEGVIQEVIEKKIESVIKETFSDTFSSYSDFGRGIKEKVRKELKIDLDNIKLQEYNDLLTQQIIEVVEKIVTTDSKEHIFNTINDMMSVDVPSTLTLTELINKFKNSLDLDDINLENEEALELIDDDEDVNITVHIEGDDMFRYLYLDPSPNISKYKCKYMINLYKNKINRIEIDNKVIDANKYMSGIYGFNKTLYKLFVIGAEITLDKGVLRSSYDNKINLEAIVEYDCEDEY